MIMVVSMIFVQAVVALAQTLEQSGTKEETVYQETYYDEDGDLVTETLRKITYPSTRSGVYERVTYVNEKSYPNFTAALYATFSYNVANKEVSCVSKYSRYDGLNSLDEEILSDTGKGTSCTATLKFYYSDRFNNKTIKVTCNYKGDPKYS